MKTTIKDLQSSAAFTKYKNSYMKKGGMDEIHREVFKATQKLITPRRTLYPGCHRHLTASLAFSNVVYMDCDNRVADVYQDDVCRDFIMAHKFYEGTADYEFICADVLNYPKCRNNSKGKKSKNDSDIDHHLFDLFISLSAGVLSPAGEDLIKDGGFALLNDGHSDACSAFLNPHYSLYAVWEDCNNISDGDASGQFNLDESELKEHFRLLNGDYITEAHVEESIRIGSVSKRSFKLRKTSPFYLFQKIDGERQRKRKRFSKQNKNSD